jgi:hypothetical protein
MDVLQMTINGHLLLLVAATGLFVRVWNANGQTKFSPVTSARIQPAIARPLQPQPVATSTAVVHLPVSVSTQTTGPAEEVWTVGNSPIPLPAGIAAGNYRVVDDTGRVARLEIAAADIATDAASSSEAAADFYLMNVDNRRWYFIRLQSPVAVDVRNGARDAVSDSAPETEGTGCPFLNRKFDFSGYDTSSLSDESTVDESATEEIARPDPPELPVSR